jgi:large subunit ribosomal protein L17
MRHRIPRNQLARPYDQRRALLRALATELLRHDEIETTLGKAKAVRSEAEKMITLAKRGKLAAESAGKGKKKEGDAQQAAARQLHKRRQLSAYLYDEDVVKRVIDEVAPRYADREGGYTRIIKSGNRRGDAAPMAIIQLV